MQPPPPHVPSDLEAKNYYYGLYSRPVLVARTGTDIWECPTGPEAYLHPKQLRPIGNHPLKDVWEDHLAAQVHKILNSKEVQWTSTDVARIGFVRENVTPVVIWIGVLPNTLTNPDGLDVAMQCKQVLLVNDIVDVEVEIRESTVIHYIGPKLYRPLRSFHPTAQLVQPLTSTLGPSICNRDTPWVEGTGGFYVTDQASQLYLITARHVVFKPDITNNHTYRRKSFSQRRINVALFGSSGFSNYQERIGSAIERENMLIDSQESLVKASTKDLDGMPLEDAEREEAEKLVKKARDAIFAFRQLSKDIERGWGNIENRILGYVHFAPPIAVGVPPNEYTQDYAVIRIDSTKIDSTNFIGNAIDLGTEIDQHNFTRLMFPNPKNQHSFKYPPNRLLKVRDIITDSEMRSPQILDENGNQCILVMKRGSATGLTLGRANNIVSFVRNYFNQSDPLTSKEWAIYPYNNRSGPFSARGDSGSAIVDYKGRLGGLITGGSGLTDSTDITYATPVSFILDSLKSHRYNVTVEATLPSPVL
ncbi:hypothetical protein HOY82DRAFT_511576 [Tuber indicum]|nr:hypothetical protein HOY82DRAFT_511576 [Tuber indicum]